MRLDSFRRKALMAACFAALTAVVVTGCGGSEGANAPAEEGGSSKKPFRITIATSQVNEIPPNDNEVELAIEEYTNTELDMQWIPSSAYIEKVNVMIASDEMPMMLRVKYEPQIISAIQSGLFWEVGPYLKDYPNLSAQHEQYYENIKVDGKIYGVPLFRDIGRSAFIYRKDWFDRLGLKQPTTADDWYDVLKALALNDPDQNGKKDTYGMILDKNVSGGTAATLTRIAVSLGAPNMWDVDADGKFTPIFMHPAHFETVEIFRKLYEEQAVNQDFAALDGSEAEKMYDAGRGGVRIAVTGNAKSMHERLVKTIPDGVFDLEPLRGPNGIRLPGQEGNNGFYVFPKSTVKSEEELKSILSFVDKMLDEPMSVLQLRGIEGKHFVRIGDGKTEFSDFDAFQREVKPYRDMLFNFEGYNVPPLKDTPQGEKGLKVAQENLNYVVPNPALTLSSKTYSERGAELDQIINDAVIKYIMGKIDRSGYDAEIERWRSSGGGDMIKEYEEAYSKTRQ
ncbi:extracellular solute-binding protein [Paenibacillus alkalitolerans]|uniref:extracellular solute-binding protein n=1 Tax=Paenibacillus alkalitolerans TaxID=2799335 RepID=UPI0018F6F320|nr:extracellular solute-binding protein [Paenibacillus alkalitolerans]